MYMAVAADAEVEVNPAAKAVNTKVEVRAAQRAAVRAALGAALRAVAKAAAKVEAEGADLAINAGPSLSLLFSSLQRSVFDDGRAGG
jgi:hypothetical protein